MKKESVLNKIIHIYRIIYARMQIWRFKFTFKFKIKKISFCQSGSVCNHVIACNRIALHIWNIFVLINEFSLFIFVAFATQVLNERMHIHVLLMTANKFKLNETKHITIICICISTYHLFIWSLVSKCTLIIDIKCSSERTLHKLVEK